MYSESTVAVGVAVGFIFLRRGLSQTLLIMLGRSQPFFTEASLTLPLHPTHITRPIRIRASEPLLRR